MTFLRLLVILFGILSATTLADAFEIEPSSQAEGFVRAQFAKGETADLAQRFSNPSQRGLSSGFIYDLIAAPGKIGARRGLSIANAVFPEGLDLENAEIPFDLELKNCLFLDDVELSQSLFKKSLKLNGSEFEGYFNLVRAVIEGNLELGQTHFKNPNAEADLTDTRVNGSLDIHEAIFAGKAFFIHDQIAGNLDAQKARFEHYQIEESKKFGEPASGEPMDSASFDSIKVGGYAFFKGAKFDSSVTFAYAEFTRNLGMEEVQLGNPNKLKLPRITFNNMKVGNHAFFHGAVFDGWADFGQVEIGGKFEAHNSEFNSCYSSTSFLNLKADIADFSSAKFGQPTSKTMTCNSLPHEYLVDGMEYRELKAINLVEFLDQASFSSDNYVRLESMLKRQGNEGAANSIYIKRRWREKDSLGWPGKIGNLLLYALVGYGRRPWLAFLWSAGVVMAGCFIFRRGEMELQNPENAGRRFSPFWYSLDQFLPAPNLGEDSVWQPRADRRLPTIYAKIHAVLGWLLIPIGIGAISGLIK